MKKISLILSGLLLLSGVGFGQINPSNNQYVLNPMSINPAFLPAVAPKASAVSVATYMSGRLKALAATPAFITSVSSVIRIRFRVSATCWPASRVMALPPTSLTTTFGRGFRRAPLQGGFHPAGFDLQVCRGDVAAYLGRQ